MYMFSIQNILMTSLSIPTENENVNFIGLNIQEDQLPFVL